MVLVAQIIVDVPLMQTDRPYSYLIPEAMQGQIAIGSGGIFGQGFNVSNLLIPVRESDMIFTVIAEDFGFIGSVVPKDYTFINSINVLIIVVFGGLGSMTGTIVAAILLGILNMVLQNVASIRMIIYSLALILVMIFRPGGLLGTWELNFSRFFKNDKEVN